MPPFYVDNTMLTSVGKCDSQLFIRYLMHRTMREERDTLLSGQAGHEALAHYFKKDDIPGALQKFRSIYEAWGNLHVDPEHRLSPKNCLTILHMWLWSHPKEKLPFQVVDPYVEIVGRVPLDEHGDFCLVIKPDLIASMFGSYVIVDNKFTGRISEDWLKQWLLSSQLSGYVFGARYGEMQTPTGWTPLRFPVIGAVINAIELSKLPSDPRRKCPKHKLPYAECAAHHANWKVTDVIPREEGQLLLWRTTALKLAQRIKQMYETYGTLQDVGQLGMQGMFLGECRWCELLNQCVTGRNPEFIEANTVYHPWNPMEVRHGRE